MKRHLLAQETRRRWEKKNETPRTPTQKEGRAKKHPPRRRPFLNNRLRNTTKLIGTRTNRLSGYITRCRGVASSSGPRLSQWPNRLRPRPPCGGKENGQQQATWRPYQGRQTRLQVSSRDANKTNSRRLRPYRNQLLPRWQKHRLHCEYNTSTKKLTNRWGIAMVDDCIIVRKTLRYATFNALLRISQRKQNVQWWNIVLLTEYADRHRKKVKNIRSLPNCW